MNWIENLLSVQWTDFTAIGSDDRKTTKQEKDELNKFEHY